MIIQLGGSEIKVTNISEEICEIEIIDGPAQGCIVEFNKENSISIGRGDDNILRVNDKELSNRHAKLSYNNISKSFEIVDLGSTNRTWVRLSPINNISDKFVINHGDIFRCGELTFLIDDTNNINVDRVEKIN